MIVFLCLEKFNNENNLILLVLVIARLVVIWVHCCFCVLILNETQIIIIVFDLFIH